MDTGVSKLTVLLKIHFGLACTNVKITDATKSVKLHSSRAKRL